MRLENPNFMVLTLPPDDLDAQRVNHPEMTTDEYLTNYLTANHIVPSKLDIIVIPPSSDLYDEAFETLQYAADANDTVFAVLDRDAAIVRVTEDGETAIKAVRLVWTNRVPMLEEGSYTLH